MTDIGGYLTEAGSVKLTAVSAFIAQMKTLKLDKQRLLYAAALMKTKNPEVLDTLASGGLISALLEWISTSTDVNVIGSFFQVLHNLPVKLEMMIKENEAVKKLRTLKKTVKDDSTRMHCETLLTKWMNVARTTEGLAEKTESLKRLSDSTAPSAGTEQPAKKAKADPPSSPAPLTPTTPNFSASQFPPLKGPSSLPAATEIKHVVTAATTKPKVRAAVSAPKPAPPRIQLASTSSAAGRPTVPATGQISPSSSASSLPETSDSRSPVIVNPSPFNFDSQAVRASMTADAHGTSAPSTPMITEPLFAATLPLSALSNDKRRKRVTFRPDEHLVKVEIVDRWINQDEDGIDSLGVHAAADNHIDKGEFVKYEAPEDEMNASIPWREPAPLELPLALEHRPTVISQERVTQEKREKRNLADSILKDSPDEPAQMSTDSGPRDGGFGPGGDQLLTYPTLIPYEDPALPPPLPAVPALAPVAAPPVLSHLPSQVMPLDLTFLKQLQENLQKHTLASLLHQQYQVPAPQVPSMPLQLDKLAAAAAAAGPGSSGYWPGSQGASNGMPAPAWGDRFGIQSNSNNNMNNRDRDRERTHERYSNDRPTHRQNSRPLCKFHFGKGYCNKRDQCTFSHER